MDDIIQFYLNLRTLNKKLSKEFGQKFPTGENAFGLLHNTSTLASELLDSYKTKWTGINTVGYTQEQIDSSKEQNRQRVTVIERMSYIQTISEIEFCSKLMVDTLQIKSLQDIKKNLDEQTQKRKNFRVYLRNIMYESQKINLISKNSFDKWHNLIVFRNCCIHNNTIPEKDDDVVIEDMTIHYRKGKQTQGDLLFIPKLTEKVVNLYKEWTDVL